VWKSTRCFRPGCLASSTVKSAAKPKPINVVGPEVRRLRIQAGLSQPAFAAKCQRAGWDISRDIVARIEGGSRCVEDRELVMLAKSLGCALAELFPKDTRGVFEITPSPPLLKKSRQTAGPRPKENI
jgi:hypothetical protein